MLRKHLPISIACLVASSSHAASGHHSVDDATMLDPGQCQVETWFERFVDGDARVWHVGPACRVGAVELGLNLDAVRTSDGRTNVGGVQVKWVRRLSEQVSIGAVATAAWQDETPHHVGSNVVIPLTWQATETLQVHLNLGRDFLHGAPDTTRGGVAAEWTPSKTWSFIAERFREFRNDRWRVGARLFVSPDVSVDLSRAQGLGSAPSSWALGVNWQFDR